MSKIIVVYGSTTGNTEWAAKEIAKDFAEAGHEVDVKNAAGIDPSGLCNGYDLAVFGCSTWGQDEIELQDDFVPLFDAFDKIGAESVKTAVFGCGDDDYEYYCGAVDAITDKLVALKSQVVGGKLKINGDPSDSLDTIKKWVKDVLAAL